MRSLLRMLSVIWLLLGLLSGCGGGGGAGGAPSGSTLPPAPPPVPPPVTEVPPPIVTSITLQSDAGDPIGQGLSYRYARTNAVITVSAEKNRLVVQVEGDEQWTGVFQTGGSATELKVGEYPALERYVDGMDASKGGLAWWGNGRTCVTSTGWLAIDNVVYANGQLVSISLRFQRNCNGATAALHGEVKYSANDKTASTSPAIPPGDLWRPPASVAATAGNYAYFESADGDYVGLGKTFLFDRRNAVFQVSGGDLTAIHVTGDDVWAAEIRGVAALGQLVPGYYPDVKGARFDNPAKGGLSWTAAGRGCSRSSGWFVVDAITYGPFGSITLMDLRFEQHCEGREAPLRGAIHYSSVPDPYADPVNTSAGSWRAPAALLPATDNFLYMQSDANEPLGKGISDLQTSRNAAFEVSADGNTVQVYGKGNHTWSAQFHAPNRFAQVVPGSYDGVTSPPGDSVTSGALYVTADGYGCDTRKGWVVVDSASYVAGKLVSIELRFEQLCASGNPRLGLLHGHLRWRADVPDAFPGPETPPGTFWRPGRALPAGNYVYLMSDPSDFVGDGEALFTPLDSAFELAEKDGKVIFTLRGDTNWSGTFETMRTAGKILPGYYGGLTGAFRPARGSFSWGGNGHGCNESSSGVVIDRAVYAGDKLSELQLRFEQHCENEPGALRAEIHWFASDTRQPAGPAVPIPASLWRAPAGALPDSGNYLYIQSEPGESIGGGKTYLLTPKNAALFLNAAINYHDFSGGFFSLDARPGTQDGGPFNLSFQTMSSVSQLQVGFYDRTARYPFHNTAFGGLSLMSQSACNQSIGWMALDKVTYMNGTLKAVHGRFTQYCDGYPPAVHGEFNWEG